jgi:TonB family protein
MQLRVLLLTLFLVLPSCCLAAHQKAVPDLKQEDLSVLHLVSQSQVPEANKNGYSYPKCIDCAPPQCTHVALAHKFQGTMTLILVVTLEGRAKDIQAPEPLQYGLTETAVEAVKKWKFKPATGPDGKPAAVRQKIEITFNCSNGASEPAYTKD